MTPIKTPEQIALEVVMAKFNAAQNDAIQAWTEVNILRQSLAAETEKVVALRTELADLKLAQPLDKRFAVNPQASAGVSIEGIRAQDPSTKGSTTT